MRILVPTSYYLPEQIASSYLDENLREVIAANGIEMRVITPMPSRNLPKGISSVPRYEELYDGKITIYRFPLFKEKKGTVRRTFRYILQIIKQYFICIHSDFCKNCDFISVASTPPIIGVMAVLVKKRKKFPFLYTVQDIFPDSLVGSGLIKKGGFIWRLGRKIEDYVYKNADKIVVISEGFKKNLLVKGVSEEKIEVIYNWVDEDAVVDIPKEQNVLFERYGLQSEKFYISYSGNIGLTQNMDLLLDVMSDLQTEEPSINLVLVGDGAYKTQVESIVKEKELANVILLPFQPFEDISHVFSIGDVGLVISKPGVGENSIPSKTWSIMSASRPVLANFDENELKTIIEDNHCGLFTKAGDKQALKNAILYLYSNKAQCIEFGKNGRQFILDNLSKGAGTQKYIKVLKGFEKNKET